MSAETYAPQQRFQVARPLPAWYAVCRSGELARRPVARRLFDVPMVLFRGPGGAPVALLDRCPHRNAPLSRGRVVDARIECPYHGWQLDEQGACRHVPALRDVPESRARRATVYPCREEQGFVWVWPRRETPPASEPVRLVGVGEPGYAGWDYTLHFETTLFSLAENLLDVPHTAVLHRGLVRAAPSRPITAVVRHDADRVEAEYLGEPPPSGIVGKLLAPQGGTTTHFDRFVRPCLVQVEYRLGDTHVVFNHLLTPVSDFHTVMNTALRWRLPLPALLMRPVLAWIVRRAASQDRAMLAAQTDLVRSLGSEHFASTAADLFEPHLRRLLAAADGGESKPTEEAPVEILV